jgi:hypothetical protein
VPETAGTGPDASIPASLRSTITGLEDAGVARVFADYWVAYRLDFESGERIIASPAKPVRNPVYDRMVRSDATPAYLFLRHSTHFDWFAKTMADRNIPWRSVRVGDFVVAFPSRRVLPEQLPGIARP